MKKNSLLGGKSKKKTEKSSIPNERVLSRPIISVSSSPPLLLDWNPATGKTVNFLRGSKLSVLCSALPYSWTRTRIQSWVWIITVMGRGYFLVPCSRHYFIRDSLPLSRIRFLVARRGGGQSRGGSERASERARRKETAEKEVERKGRLGVGHGRRGGGGEL